MRSLPYILSCPGVCVCGSGCDWDACGDCVQQGFRAGRCTVASQHALTPLVDNWRACNPAPTTTMASTAPPQALQLQLEVKPLELPIQYSKTSGARGFSLPWEIVLSRSPRKSTFFVRGATIAGINGQYAPVQLTTDASDVPCFANQSLGKTNHVTIVVRQPVVTEYGRSTEWRVYSVQNVGTKHQFPRHEPQHVLLNASTNEGLLNAGARNAVCHYRAVSDVSSNTPPHDLEWQLHDTGKLSGQYRGKAAAARTDGFKIETMFTGIQLGHFVKDLGVQVKQIHKGLAAATVLSKDDCYILGVNGVDFFANQDALKTTDGKYLDDLLTDMKINCSTLDTITISYHSDTSRHAQEKNRYTLVEIAQLETRCSLEDLVNLMATTQSHKPVAVEGSMKTSKCGKGRHFLESHKSEFSGRSCKLCDGLIKRGDVQYTCKTCTAQQREETERQRKHNQFTICNNCYDDSSDSHWYFGDDQGLRCAGDARVKQHVSVAKMLIKLHGNSKTLEELDLRKLTIDSQIPVKVWDALQSAIRYNTFVNKVHFDGIKVENSFQVRQSVDRFFELCGSKDIAIGSKSPAWMDVWDQLEKDSKSDERKDKWPDVEPCCTSNDIECTDYYDVCVSFAMRPIVTSLPHTRPALCCGAGSRAAPHFMNSAGLTL